VIYLYKLCYIDHDWDFLPLAPESSILKSILRMGRFVGWEGDFIHKPRILYFPRIDNYYDFAVGYIWKQQNNGITFLASPFKLDYLEEMNGCDDEVVAFDDDNLDSEDRFNAAKERCKIENIISRFIKLEPAGVYLKGTCCFCDKENSFTVTPGKSIFYCFNCHNGGDVIAFIARKNNISQINALELLESLSDDEITGKLS
jgi:hypothetical protein